MKVKHAPARSAGALADREHATRRATILVADDRDEERYPLCAVLGEEGYRVREATTGDEALAALSASDALDDGADDAIDLVLLDIRMPGMDGLEVLKLRAGAPKDIPIVMLTKFGHSDQVVRATQYGAADYICKPYDLDEVLTIVHRVLDEREQARRSEMCDLSDLGADPSTHIIGKSRPMLEVFRQIGLAARARGPVLVTGETGTGKELVASTIHWASPRALQPFVPLNCATVPETLIESELFGCYKGAFFGADHDRPGLIEQANGGTLFLDEIGDMPQSMQKKLLRVLQDGVVRRLGAKKDQITQVDVRFVVATNRDLAVERALDHFRDDLFHRLHVHPIHLPPLRERKSDIPALVAHFLSKHKMRTGRAAVEIAREALKKLEEHDWPGNVRELEDVIIRAMTQSGGRRITPTHIVFDDQEKIPLLIDVRARILGGSTMDEMVRELHAKAFQAAMEAEDGDADRAAARLEAELVDFANMRSEQPEPQ